MFKKLRWKKVKNITFYGILYKFTKPIPPGLWIANFWFQRVLRINADYDWMINFTSRAVGDIEIGKNVWVSFATSGGCYFQGNNKIIIGDDTIFAPNVSIISANHSLDNFSTWEKAPPIEIGKKCWIGTGVTILPGVKLGDNVIVGAGSVVTKSFPSNCIIAGVPSVIIKKVKNE